jgi:hypothetical protein
MGRTVICDDTKEVCFSYEEYLKSKHWQRFRLKALKQHGKHCMLCGEDNIPFFHVHHLTYDNIGHELMEDVVVLCPLCHSIVHIEGFDIKAALKRSVRTAKPIRPKKKKTPEEIQKRKEYRERERVRIGNKKKKLKKQKNIAKKAVKVI